MSGGVVSIIIDGSTSRVITGTYEWDSSGGGKLLMSSGSSLPGTPTAKEVFWNTSDNVLYRRNDADTAWVAVEATAAAHALGGSSHSADTLANLNAKITDATLDDSSATRDPNAHAPSHQSGGSDAIKLDDLSAPDDNTDLDASTSSHGLMMKFPGGATNFLNADGDFTTAVDQAALDAMERSGFPNRTDSTISRTDTSPDRTFRIEPAVSTFDFYVMNEKFTKSSAQTAQWTDVPGLHYFYFDDNGDLQHTATWSDALLLEYAIVAMIFWDGTDSYMADERHGLTMSGRTHLYLHKAIGAVWVSGFGVTISSIDGDGSSNSHAQFAVDNGTFFDEDIQHNVVDGTDLELSPIAQLPIVYKSGAAGAWVIVDPDNFPCLYNGKPSGYTGTRAPYNQWTGSTWQLTEVGNNDYFLMHFMITNITGYQVIGFVGTNSYGNITNARSGVVEEMAELLALNPGIEFLPLATVCFQTGSSYTNTPKVKIVSFDDGDFVDWRTNKILPVTSTSLQLHASRHQAGGVDPIKLDDLASPDDNTDLNASTSAHGLLRKLDGTTSNFLRGDGTWAAPSGGSGGFPTGYMYGFRTYNNATNPTYQIDIEAGVCRDQADTTDLVLTSTLTVDITQSGANGLDTGSEGTWYWYYIYVIYNPTTTTYAGLLSLSSTSPTLPSGYTKYRRIGSVINNGSSDFYMFDYKSDLGRERYCSYDEEDEDNIEMLTNGAATSWTDIYLGARIPPTGLFIYLMCRYTAANYDQSAAMRNKDSSQGDPPFIIYGGANSNDATSAAVFRIWASTTRYIQYINFSSNCALTVWMKGFWDFC